MIKTKVALKEVQFYAKHGYYPEEKKIGNRFEVNLDCFFEQKADRFVNYEHLFKMVEQVIIKTEPMDFLEGLVQQIIDQVNKEYDFLDEVACEITKLTPPISQFDGKGTSVKMIWQK